MAPGKPFIADVVSALLSESRGLCRLPDDEEATMLEQMAFAIERSKDG
jgi:hypothetical protein